MTDPHTTPTKPVVLKAAQVFDGTQMHAQAFVGLDGAGRVTALWPDAGGVPPDADLRDLGNVILSPGMVDVQVNGGAGEMVGAATDLDQLRRICAAHAALGASAILPTLITNTPEVTQQVLAAGRAAAREGVQGFAGLHLEGPHLDPARKGAHDARLIRPMGQDDLAALLDAAQDLPALMVTLAPEAATLDQISQLARAGVIVSLGHTGCSADMARRAHDAGARCVTHLFNAMSGMQARAPGLVGAALSTGVQAGIIADGVHVAPECLHVALGMKAPDGLFLVSDAMAVAGTDDRAFLLDGRRVLRASGRLTLEDGTLAGADVTLPQSVAHLAGLGVPLARALAMATRIPADVIGAVDRGRIGAGARADFTVLNPDLSLHSVWCAGQRPGA
ncbi:N-acetylglucosamine-6-phosphate deacetylase [Roseinatronobacter thiooxidans]|uniref:N-acetylglucosamine-6-phosphate deacetylase n=1 Tax=Roseinatronobacter thiooxidans TaxID=121821 RepID=A0A2W7QCI6_9RHOB|nr:N-acetylglucosamine-6-phosphate deacetylase [Roseinatronobacter thiooxidans]PZX45883.1 N-acetylglucosamine-6-phosphate deacetylase [Roseinatronobacter thiooxidans]